MWARALEREKRGFLCVCAVESGKCRGIQEGGGGDLWRMDGWVDG